MNKTVEVPYNEFQEIVQALKNYRKDKEKLIKALNFLNEEIKKYNQEFAQELKNKTDKIINES